MANLSGIIYTILAADATVTGLVGQDAAGQGWKIYPLTIPQKEGVPFVRLTEIAVEPSDTKTGASTLDAIRFQVDSYASTIRAAQQIDEAIRGAIDRYRGSVTVTGDATYFVDGVRFENRNNTMEEEKDIFRISADYQVRIHRTP